MKKVLVSVLNYNGSDDTKACLASLNAINRKDIDIHTVVIDNASEEPLSVQVSDFPNIHLTLLMNKKNLGFAGGHNIGIEYALKNNMDYIIILNNDTIVDKNFVQELISVAERDDRIGVISPKIYFAKGSEYHKDRYKEDELGKIFWYAGGIMDWNNLIGRHRGVDEVDTGQYNSTEETEFATGCCMLIRTNILKEAGQFDDRYFLYYEDSDLQERIKRSGYTVYYAPNAVIWHKNAGSSGGSGSVLQDYYISRNRLLFGYLYAPLRTKFALLRESIMILLRGRKWQKKGVKDFYLNRFGKGSYTQVKHT